MTFHIAFRTTLLTGCDRFNHFLQLTPLLELEKVFGSRLTGRETFPFVSKKKKKVIGAQWNVIFNVIVM